MNQISKNHPTGISGARNPAAAADAIGELRTAVGNGIASSEAARNMPIGSLTLGTVDYTLKQWDAEIIRRALRRWVDALTYGAPDIDRREYVAPAEDLEEFLTREMYPIRGGRFDDPTRDQLAIPGTEKHGAAQ